MIGCFCGLVIFMVGRVTEVAGGAGAGAGAGAGVTLVLRRFLPCLSWLN